MSSELLQLHGPVPVVNVRSCLEDCTCTLAAAPFGFTETVKLTVVPLADALTDGVLQRPVRDDGRAPGRVAGASGAREAFAAVAVGQADRGRRPVAEPVDRLGDAGAAAGRERPCAAAAASRACTSRSSWRRARPARRSDRRLAVRARRLGAEVRDRIRRGRALPSAPPGPAWTCADRVRPERRRSPRSASTRRPCRRWPGRRQRTRSWSRSRRPSSCRHPYASTCRSSGPGRWGRPSATRPGPIATTSRPSSWR